jgi:hypothetical protein
MSKLFMYGTSLEGIEKLMMMAPNFSQRRSGIVINNYFNCKGGVVDCNCNVIHVSNRCNDCRYIHSGILFDMDKVRYKDLVKECFGKIKNHSLKHRLKFLTNKFEGEIFLNHSHKKRFYQVFHKQDIDIHDMSPRYIAILFLLTVDENLWRNSETILKINKFDIKQICLKEIDTEAYAIYQTARTISTGKEFIKISELADKELINDMTFKAIINSALINRYGAELFLITK